MFGSYLRLDLPVDAKWRAVIRAAASRITPHARRNAAFRHQRRAFYRQMLQHHASALALVSAHRL